MNERKIRYTLNNLTNLAPVDIAGVQVRLYKRRGTVRYVCAADGITQTFRYRREQSIYWHERDDLLQTHNECLDKIVAFIQCHAREEVGV